MSRRFLTTIGALWVLLLALVALIVSGVLDAPSKPVTKRRGRDVVTAWFGVIMGRWDEDVYRQVVADYNRARDVVVVEAVLIPYACYLGKINVAVATGQPPDVCWDAAYIVDGVRRRQDIPDLAVPVPEEFLPQSVRERYGESCVAAVSRDGVPMLFPAYTFIGQSMFEARADWFEKAGLDLEEILEEGWDYGEFRRALKDVQAVMRAEKGEQAYAFGFNLKDLNKLLYYDLLPSVIGRDAAQRSFLVYDADARRYRLDPEITPEKLAVPLRLMQQLLHEDGTWGRKHLGMDYGQLQNEFFEQGTLAVIWANSPGDAVAGQITHNREVDRGLRGERVKLTVLPAPVPRKGMPQVFLTGGEGWGVLRQIPGKGEAHTRRALDFARHLSSPEVLARLYRASGGLRLNLWPDPEAVLTLAPDVPSPVEEDPWLRFQWDTYRTWARTGQVYSSNIKWPDEEVHAELMQRMAPMYASSSYLVGGQGRQIAERVLFGELDPLHGAREILAGIEKTIDDFYRRASAEGQRRPAPDPGE